MGISVTNENARANKLKAQVQNIERAIQELESYENSLSSNWKSDEVEYIRQAVDRSIEQLKMSVKTINELSNKISSTVSSIKQEEDRKAAQQKAEQERKKKQEEKKKQDELLKKQKENSIKEAQTKYDNAKKAYDDLKKEYDKVKDDMWYQFWHKKEFDNLCKKLKDAKDKCDSCLASLNAAKNS